MVIAVSAMVPEPGPPARSLPMPPSPSASSSTVIPLTPVCASTRHGSSPQPVCEADVAVAGASSAPADSPGSGRSTSAVPSATTVTSAANAPVTSTGRGTDGEPTVVSTSLRNPSERKRDHATRTSMLGP